MGFYGLVLGVLAVWRVAHLLNAEDGPWGIFVRLRRRAGFGFWGELLDCFYCLSLATAVPFALLIGAHWRERVLLWPALSAGAILLERLTGDRSGKTPTYWEDPEVQDGMLRQGEKRPNLHDQTGGGREIEN
jgi:hypothetical protein